MPRANQVTATNHTERFRGIYGNVPVNQLVLAPGCGMKYLPRESSDGKMASLAAAAAERRVELGS